MNVTQCYFTRNMFTPCSPMWWIGKCNWLCLCECLLPESKEWCEDFSNRYFRRLYEEKIFHEREGYIEFCKCSLSLIISMNSMRCIASGCIDVSDPLCCTNLWNNFPRLSLVDSKFSSLAFDLLWYMCNGLTKKGKANVILSEFFLRSLIKNEYREYICRRL